MEPVRLANIQESSLPKFLAFLLIDQRGPRASKPFSLELAERALLV